MHGRIACRCTFPFCLLFRHRRSYCFAPQISSSIAQMFSLLFGLHSRHPYMLVVPQIFGLPGKQRGHHLSRSILWRKKLSPKLTLVNRTHFNKLLLHLSHVHLVYRQPGADPAWVQGPLPALAQGSPRRATPWRFLPWIQMRGRVSRLKKVFHSCPAPL